MPDTLEIISTGRGLYKAGVRGRIVDGEERIVYLGPLEHCEKTKIPEFTIRYDCGTTNEFQQYGRDFVFLTSEEGKQLAQSDEGIKMLAQYPRK